MTARRHQSDWRIWKMPVLLGVSTTVGLVAALLADGAGDVLSWLALGLPAAVAVACALKPERAHTRN
jgi:hypothetical protein